MNALPVWPHAASPWHAGEQALQQRVGAREALAEAGRRVIRAAMPAQHREFFTRLPFIITGAADAQGQPWADVLSGAPGFVQSPAADRLHIQAPASVQAGQPLALLGIEPATRRRNRANGRVLRVDEQGFDLQVLQSFGNCPQYIQARELQPVVLPNETPPEQGQALQGRAASIVAGADTFFIATQALPEAVHGGADVSHRGGQPGFVRVDQAGARLTWPDFAGNRFFNTLGNLQLEPRAGLLFIDFESGDLLQVAGRAEVLWQGPELEAFAGAQRLVQLQVDEWRLRRGAWPWRGHLREASPYLQGTGSWPRA